MYKTKIRQCCRMGFAGLVLLLVMALKANAGWYECYNFKGSVAQYPVTFSVQLLRGGYFGEPGKKDFNMVGVYKYDKHNKPIRLEGKLNLRTQEMMLYEMNGEKQSAVLKICLCSNTCEGTWTDLVSKKTLPLKLTRTTVLTDTAAESACKNVEMLQAYTFLDYYFTGIYSKATGSDRAQMDKLNIIRKLDNTVYQVIDLTQIETTSGNVRTIIYDNVEVPDGAKTSFLIWNDIGRMGGYLYVNYNPKTGKFKLNPEPEIDGPQ